MGIASKMAASPVPAQTAQQGPPGGPPAYGAQTSLVQPGYSAPQPGTADTNGRNDVSQAQGAVATGYPAVNYAAPPQPLQGAQHHGGPPPQHTMYPAGPWPQSHMPPQPHPSQQLHSPSFQQPGQYYMDVESVRFKLALLVNQNQLQTFYSPQAVHQIARQVAQKDLAGLARHWRLPSQMVMDLVALSLYDTVVMCDDSASMRLAEGGERIKDLKTILERVSSVCGLLDTDGISLHAMNGNLWRENVTNAHQAAEFVNQISFEHPTPLGTMLERKILQRHVYGPVQHGRLPKPVHVIVITDGEPTAEPYDEVKAVIKRAKALLKKSRYGAGAIAFQFAQVGTDQQAQRFLAKLDTDTRIGRLVDCTSAYEQEQAEYMAQSGEASRRFSHSRDFEVRQVQRRHTTYAGKRYLATLVINNLRQ